MPLASSGQLGRTTISDLEIGYSARNADEWDDDFDLIAAITGQAVNWIVPAGTID